MEVAIFIPASLFWACGDERGGGGGNSYNFRASAAARILSSGLSSVFSQTELAHGKNKGPVAPMALPSSCIDSLCYTPTELSGKYYAVGLLIQSSGNGMMLYFGQDSWSEITAGSTTYTFNMNVPVEQQGNIICCSGTGDLSSENTYFSNGVYMMAYWDATFTVQSQHVQDGILGVTGSHTVRFVFADDALAGARRGDLMYEDDSVFKWVDASGNFHTDRPDDALTMNTAVVNWTNPFGTQGNQTIPTISTELNPPDGGGVNVTSENEIKTEGRTYSFDFDASGLIFFPTIFPGNGDKFTSRVHMLQNIHLQGLPHSQWGDGQASASAKSTLTIDEPAQ